MNLSSETARLGTQESPAAANKQGNNDANRANRKAFQKEIDAVVEQDLQQLTSVQTALEQFKNSIFLLVTAMTAIGLAAGAGFGVYIARVHLSRPILRITDTTGFAAFVDEERAAGRLRRDDTTLLVMACGDELPANHRL